MRNFCLLTNLESARAISQALTDGERISLAQELCAAVCDPRLGSEMEAASNEIGRHAHTLQRSNITLN